jgi:diguanylate cyclase (GGDEF)-like protein/PAS domain S-box-containing protein
VPIPGSDVASQGTRPGVGTKGLAALGVRLRNALPEGRTLPEDEWRRRHRALLLLLWIQVPLLIAFGLARGDSVYHSAIEGLLLVPFAALAMLEHDRQRVASALVSLGLITSSAVLVHVWDGVIEAHFHFFVILILLTLYEDWLPFILAAAYVVLHHGATGALDPGSVYNHQAAVDHPWVWAAIHGGFIVAAGTGAVIAWRLNENVRAETREAYRQASESEERFKSAFENAPIGMVLLSVEEESLGHFLQVNRAMCQMVGRSEDELLATTLQATVHPDERTGIADLLEHLLRNNRETAQAENRYLAADGGELTGLVNMSIVHDGSGHPVHAIGQVQDVTERKRARELLEHQAYHDALTELPNRRMLMEDLEREIGGATPNDPVLLLLFDLDGFKAYNDTFGHPAGDALLSRLGHALDAAVKDRGRAYRMGGDEFCVVGKLLLDAEPLAVVAAEALTAQGEGFSVTASFGAVELPLDADTASEALRKADQRLYAHKGDGRASAGRQATDALLKALSEHKPDLGAHLSDVAELCEAVAQRLGLPSEQMTALLQAAALHDVGKVGIPDAILDKPGKLDENEWAFMRTHTQIGERILSAAPALAQAGKIVRSTHERYDGTGYPDGLAGESIPLASRVVAVCDAYTAMISDRPYRSALSPVGALAELRRNAGTQFDPAVVTAFTEVLAGRAFASSLA